MISPVVYAATSEPSARTIGATLSHLESHRNGAFAAFCRWLSTGTERNSKHYERSDRIHSNRTCTLKKKGMGAFFCANFAARCCLCNIVSYFCCLTNIMPFICSLKRPHLHGIM